MHFCIALANNIKTIFNKNKPTKTNMKKVLVAGLLAISAGAFAQDGQKNVIKVNPLSLLVKTGNVSYERQVNKSQTFQIGGYYSGISLGDIQYSGFGITPEYRFYFAGKKEAFNGVYAAPFGRYQNFTLKDKETSDKATFTSIGGGAIIGYEKKFNGGFVLDVFAGPSYNSVSFKNKSQEEEFDVKAAFKGFGIRSGITLGFAF
jgi:hypothetical protein